LIVPPEIVKDVGWNEKTELKITAKGKKIIIEKE